MKALHYYIVGVAIGALITVCASAHFKSTEDKITSTQNLPTDRYVVTAAHLEENVLQGYTKVYEDTATDTAVYVDLSNTKTDDYIGKTLFLSESFFGSVIEQNDREIILEVNDPLLIYAGLSGSRVYYKGTAVGFVSAAKDGKYLKCYLF